MVEINVFQKILSKLLLHYPRSTHIREREASRLQIPLSQTNSYTFKGARTA